MNINTTEHSISRSQIQKAVKLSCAQAMLGAIYGASTGGMFLVGYALKMGASDVQLGLLSTIPLFAVVFQLVAAYIVEKGISRKKITFVSQLINVLCWCVIALMPWLLKSVTNGVKIGVLIATVGIITAFAHLAANSRASWLGDLIPASERGSFFGRITMFGMIIGASLSVVAGQFLDVAKSGGIAAFSWLFIFGMLIGLINTALFIPQKDVPIKSEKETTPFSRMIMDTFKNKGLMMMALFSLVWSLQNIAGPFYAAYVIRDLKMPYIGLGILSASSGLMMIATSSFWGRMVDKHGCKPILIVAAAAVAPTCIAWGFVDTALKAYLLIVPINLFQGFWMAGIQICTSTIIYKVTPEKGRSVQLAIHSIIAVVATAPIPTLGGYLPKLFGTDLRITFLLVGIFQLAAAFVAMRIPEADAGKPISVLVDMRDRIFRRTRPTGV